MPLLDCPFCGVLAQNESVLTRHVEQIHLQDSDNVSGALATSDSLHPSRSQIILNSSESPANDSDDSLIWLDCPEECGDTILWQDLQQQLEGHLAERLGQRNDVFRDVTSTQSRFNSEEDQHTQRMKFSSSSKRCGVPKDDGPKVGLSRQTISTDDKQNVKAPPKRLGYDELGPYAFEDKMPDKIRQILIKSGNRTVTQKMGRSEVLYRDVDSSNETFGLIPVIRELFIRQNNPRKVWLCHPSVCHISRMKGEGGFCGYRNIMMLLSYYIGAKCPGWQRLASAKSFEGEILESSTGNDQESTPRSRMRHPKNGAAKVKESVSPEQKILGQIPGILELQTMIQEAWNNGYDHHGARIQTGGIIGTRKYIGTPEVHSLFASNQIPFMVHVFKDSVDGKGVKTNAHRKLIETCKQYFSTGTQTPRTGFFPAGTPAEDKDNRVKVTPHAPLYMQQPGHSLTVIGVEEGSGPDDCGQLIVFDPGFSTPPAVAKLVDRVRCGSRLADINRPDSLLNAFTRNRKSLSRYSAFELFGLKSTSAYKDIRG